MWYKYLPPGFTRLIERSNDDCCREHLAVLTRADITVIDCLILVKMVPICCGETSVTKYQPTPRNVPEKRRPHCWHCVILFKIQAQQCAVVSAQLLQIKA
jgi:hypothetical protein